MSTPEVFAQQLSDAWATAEPSLRAAEKGSPDDPQADDQLRFNAHRALDSVKQAALSVMTAANEQLAAPVAPGYLLAREFAASGPLLDGCAAVLKAHPPETVGAVIGEVIRRNDRAAMIAWAVTLNANRRELDPALAAPLRELEGKFPAVDRSAEWKRVREDAVAAVEQTTEWRKALPRQIDTSSFRYR
jgi:hypothetical protein